MSFEIPINQKWFSALSKIAEECLDLPMTDMVSITITLKSKFFGTVITGKFKVSMYVHMPGPGVWSVQELLANFTLDQRMCVFKMSVENGNTIE